MNDDELLNLYVFNNTEYNPSKYLGLIVISTWATLLIIITLNVF